MNFDNLKNVWKEEMENTSHLVNFSLIQIAADAKEQNRQIYFGGIVFAGTASAIAIMFSIMWITGGFQLTLSNILFTCIMPAMFAYVAFLFLSSIKSNTEENWTLSAHITIEIEKAENKIRLFKRLPFCFILPMLLFILGNSYFNYLEKNGTYIPDTKSFMFYASTIILYGLTALGISMEQKRKLSPILNRLLDLEKELKTDQ